MPTAITSSTSTFSITTGGFYFMGEDEVLITSGVGIDSSADNLDLFVNGQIYSDTRGIFSRTSGDDVAITIGADATVVAVTSGVAIGSDRSNLVNFGSITSLGSFAVNLEAGAAGDTYFVNYGSVSGKTDGLRLQGNGQSAVNYGTIDGQTGVDFTEDDSFLINHGTISGTSSLGAASGVGIEIAGSTDDIVIKNYGTITGTTASLISGDASDNLIVKNHGLMVGDIDLADGDDTYTAGADGVVVGRILTDEGDDFVRGGHHADDIDGGADNDELLGRGGDDLIAGGTGDDLIQGGQGDDILDGNDNIDEIRGGAGEDVIDGGNGTDTLYGGKDDDTLTGGKGNDSIFGGSGDDVLSGGNGDDILHGGKGDDEIKGGGGADVFVFRGNDGRDTITDFTNGVDKIDLSDFGQFSFASLTSNYTVDLHGPTGSFIDFGNGDVLILEDMVYGNLDTSDFIF